MSSPESFRGIKFESGAIHRDSFVDEAPDDKFLFAGFGVFSFRQNQINTNTRRRVATTNHLRVIGYDYIPMTNRYLSTITISASVFLGTTYGPNTGRHNRYARYNRIKPFFFNRGSFLLGPHGHHGAKYRQRNSTNANHHTRCL